MQSEWFNFFKQEPWEPGRYLTCCGRSIDQAFRYWDGAAWQPSIPHDCELKWCGLVEPPAHLSRYRSDVSNAGQNLKGNAPASSVHGVRLRGKKANRKVNLDADASWPFPREADGSSDEASVEKGPWIGPDERSPTDSTRG